MKKLFVFALTVFLFVSIPDAQWQDSLNLVIEDPLTDNKSVAVKVTGGVFTSEGWKSTSDADRLYYILPENSRLGKIEYMAKGYGLGWPLGGDCRRNITGVYDVYRPRNLLKDPSCDCNGLTFRVFSCDRRKDGSVRNPMGQTALKINGSAYSPSGGEYGAKSASSRVLDWNPQTWYHMEISWANNMASFKRDGVEHIKFAFPDKNLSLIHVYVNADYYHEWNGVAQITHKNVKLYSNIATNLPVLPGKSSPKNCIRLSSHPFNGNFSIRLKDLNWPCDLKLFNLAGRLVKRAKIRSGSHFIIQSQELGGSGVYVLDIQDKENIQLYKNKVIVIK
jgi:hypothetical protein